jgi:hypothetical protein
MGAETLRTLQSALTLPDNERADVSAELLASLDGDADPNAESELAEEISRRAESAGAFLRMGDAILAGATAAEHLVTASLHGFQELYSHDKHVLSAAAAFGLKGIDIVP